SLSLHQQVRRCQRSQLRSERPQPRIRPSWPLSWIPPYVGGLSYSAKTSRVHRPWSRRRSHRTRSSRALMVSVPRTATTVVARSHRAPLPPAHERGRPLSPGAPARQPRSLAAPLDGSLRQDALVASELVVVPPTAL